MMNKKGQGALEYLLLIGGAVLVAVIVITLLLQITSEGEASTTVTAEAAAQRQCDARNVALCGEDADFYLDTPNAKCLLTTAYLAC